MAYRSGDDTSNVTAPPVGIVAWDVTHNGTTVRKVAQLAHRAWELAVVELPGSPAFGECEVRQVTR